MKNKTVSQVIGEAWEPVESPENEKEFAEFLSLLERDIADGIRSNKSAPHRLSGRRIIANHMKPLPR